MSVIEVTNGDNNMIVQFQDSTGTNFQADILKNGEITFDFNDDVSLSLDEMFKVIEIAKEVSSKWLKH